MGLFDFLKRKKKKADAAEESESAVVLPLEETGLEGIDPPETRYTQEYKEFLDAQEAGENTGAQPEEDGAQP